MNKIYQVYQVSDSTGETLDRIFLAIKAQFSNFNCKTIHHSFTRTKNQVDNIIFKAKTEKNIIILYTIVDNNLAKHLSDIINAFYRNGISNIKRILRKYEITNSPLSGCFLGIDNKPDSDLC